MQSRFPFRHAGRRLAVAAALAGAIAGACAGPYGNPSANDVRPVAGHPLKDAHYGDTLFHFFQDHYFTSITTLMVSQHFDRVSQHADEAEVLRGGMLLSYGLHREAGATAPGTTSRRSATSAATWRKPSRRSRRSRRTCRPRWRTIERCCRRTC